MAPINRRLKNESYKDFTFRETGGVESQGGFFGDLIELGDVGDMNGLESHL